MFDDKNTNEEQIDLDSYGEDENNDEIGIIKNRDISKEMQDSFLDYAMSIIVARALPDVRDGLKPVHRRILYAMNDLGMTADKPHKKSARIVGEVIGKYHPHGDSAVYDTMVRMAQDFSYRYMLVDGHGNFGSIDRDGAAAMRYTEARMSKIAMELMRDINKDTVDFDFNYDGEEREPTVLPAKYPNLLANGSSGIAVGMATNIPSHNLSELIDGLISFSHDRTMEVSELLQYIEGPDFATGAQIIGRSGIIKAYNTGNGSVTIRSKYHVEDMPNGKKRVVVTEIPYLVNKELMVEKMADLVKDKKIEGVTDIVDVSNREGIGINIELRKDVQPEVIMNQFFRLSPLQTSFGINMIALVKGEPKKLTLPEIMGHYLDHQVDVITRRTKFELKKAEERKHILEGLKIALDHIDEIINIIRSNRSDQESLDEFNERFGLTEIQGKAILSMQLRRLGGLEREKIDNEYNELMKQVNYYKELLADENKILDIVREELLDIQKRYGDKRRTEILDGDFEMEDEDLIPEKDIIIYMTNNGYIKRTTVDTFKTQHRGGRGIKGMNTYEDDTIDKIIPMSTHSDLLFFTNLGRVYKIRGHRVPEQSRTSKGTPVINLIDLAENETINTLIPIKEYIDTEFLVFVTKDGTFKRVSVQHFANINKNGKIAINIKDDDELVSVRKTNGTNEILIAGSNGKVLRFEETRVRPTGRTAVGVRGFNVDGGHVIGMCTDKDGEFVLVVSEKGYGKMSPIDAYRKANRGGKGVITLNITEKNGQLIAMRTVNADEDLAIINNNGVLIRIPIEQISISGRNTQGVKLINLRDDETVVNIAVLKKEDDLEQVDDKIEKTNLLDE